MLMTALAALLFFFGYLAMRSRVQALLFLAIGAGYQWLSYLVSGDPANFGASVAISLASGLGYIAWSSSRKVAEGRALGWPRLLVFAGFALNWALAIWLLSLTGSVDFHAQSANEK